jgi:hypothetical protein
LAQYTLNTRPEVPPKVLWCNASEGLLGKLVLAKHPKKRVKVLCSVRMAEKSVPAHRQFLCSNDTAQKLLPKEELQNAAHPGVPVDVHEASVLGKWWYSSARWGISASGMGAVTAILVAVGSGMPSWWVAIPAVTAAIAAVLAFVHTWRSPKL